MRRRRGRQGWARRARPRKESTGEGMRSPAFRREVVAGTTAAIVAVLIVGLLAGFGDWASGLVDGGADGLEIDGTPVVSNGPEATVEREGELFWTRATTPRVDIVVENRGDEVVRLVEARVTIEDSTRLESCEGGGDPVPVARDYSVPLVLQPFGDERVQRADLSELVRPGRHLTIPLLFADSLAGLDHLLFAIHVELIAEPRQTLDAGRFVLGVPGPVSRVGYVLPEDEKALEVGELPYERVARKWCYRRNLAEVERLMAHDGERSPEIAALSDIPLVEGWVQEPEADVARSAVERLLAVEDPVLAAFAAEATGDEEFEQRAKERSAEILLRYAGWQVESEWEGYLQEAAINARSALALVPSARGRDLLLRANARLQAAREGDLILK